MEIKFLINKIELLTINLSKRIDDSCSKSMLHELNCLYLDLMAQIKQENELSSNERWRLENSCRKALIRERRNAKIISNLKAKITRLEDGLFLAQKEAQASKNKIEFDNLSYEQVYQELLKAKAKILKQYQSQAHPGDYKKKSQLFLW